VPRTLLTSHHRMIRALNLFSISVRSVLVSGRTGSREKRSFRRQ
jgi:hypothetical protein